MNKVLRIILGALGLLLFILSIIFIAVKEGSLDPAGTVTPIIVGISSPNPTRTPMPPPMAPTPTRTIDPSSGTNIPRHTVPSTYTNIPAPTSGTFFAKNRYQKELGAATKLLIFQGGLPGELSHGFIKSEPDEKKIISRNSYKHRLRGR